MVDDDALRRLAEKAGVAPRWIDTEGAERQVSPDTLRALLHALDIPCASQSDLRTSEIMLKQRARRTFLPPLITAQAHEPVRLPLRYAENTAARIEFESGGHADALLEPGPDGGARLRPIAEAGYHRLTCNGQSITIAVAPARAWTFSDVAPGEKIWGLAVQTYGLRADSGSAAAACSFGAGGFGEAAELARRAAAQGADGLMISPCHALFHADGGHFSPYSPSSRFFYNALLADPAATFSTDRIAAALTRVSASPPGDASADGLIDWPASAACKQTLLRALHDGFSEGGFADASSRLHADFQRFRRSGGLRLERHAIFESLHAERLRADPGQWHWRSWPADLQQPDSAAVAHFAQSHAQDVGYHIFLQWLASRSLAATQRAALESGMRIGLINDLAVGVNSGGSHAWCLQNDILTGLTIGAPPDPLAPRGQNWGLTTYRPDTLVDSGFETFIATLRAAMVPTGGVRIDHVMGLTRLWLIPEGGSAADGAYVAYPFEDMLRLIVLESARARKVVIGEDLGTVPEGLRERLSHVGLAGMRVLLFERDWHGYRAPCQYPPEAIAMTTTHDTPTLVGWRGGRDIDWRARLDHLPPGQTEQDARRQRADDVAALAHEIAQSEHAADLPEPGSDSADIAAARLFAGAAIGFASQSEALFIAVPLEDIAGQEEQPNLPGTSDEHPNWRRRYEADVGAMLDTPTAQRNIALLRRHRR